MTDHHTASILAFVIVAGFFGLMVAILSGQVDMKEATTAEIVGALFGYMIGLMNPIIARYFRERPDPPDSYRPLQTATEGNEP